MRVHVDRGGTFTDVVSGGVIRKLPSDTARIGSLADSGLVVGTTVATNALLERRGVPTLLLVTAGFEDLVHLGDMARPALFDPDAPLPAPLCMRIVGVRGRIDGEGAEIAPLELPALDLDGVEAVAIALLNSPRNPAHERAVAAALPRGLFVSLGHERSPELGYLARVETTLLDAALSPILQAALRRDALPADTRMVRSDGSLCPVDLLRAPDAILSGPASGVAAVAAVAAQAGIRRAIGLDMGGTSTDVCCVDTEAPLPVRAESRVDGLRIRRPMLEVETIAAGGGSILRADGIRLRVGPDSAGADPGPQCRGRGGPPTLTDAALVAGLVDPRAFDPPLDPDRVALPGPAEAFLDVAREHMAAAVRRITAARGLDPRDHALVAFGGAAGQHACAVAERLGITTVLVHPAASVLCAWGQAHLREEETRVAPIWAPMAEWARVEAAWARVRAEIGLEGEVIRTVDLRLRGTDHALTVGEVSPESAFHARHREVFGFDREGGLEIVNARVRVRGPAAEPVDIPLPALALPCVGPGRLDLVGTSVEVRPGWRATARAGLLWLERETRATTRSTSARTPEGVEIWSRRFAGVAEEAGETLRRLARSVNIRERLDFSCAVFDEAGRLVANAPHVPVHLGAMGETVRDLLRRHPDVDETQAWLCNDPRAGGSHLPDLTVVRAVVHEGRRWFVANRAHHVDVGGMTPGSMPPHSRSLADEGLVFRHTPLLREGRLVPPPLPGCRAPGTVVADLEAQVAANTVAAAALRHLGPASVTTAWMGHVADAAAEAMARVLPTLRGEAEDTVDGVRLHVRFDHAEPGRLRVDLRGSGGPHPGNLNAPRAVVLAAVLYVLRVRVGEELPLNEGVLRHVEVLTSPGILDPPENAAIVGGNVETSQRLVDLLLQAAQLRAGSQGTMNNLSFGGEGWAYYETLGGGLGASAAGPGASGRQVHMTNTRATDAEILEARLPLRVWRHALRHGSGGGGRHRGGDGLVREIEVLAPCTAALLAGRRDRGAPGLAGGGDGSAGRDVLVRGGVSEPWDGRSIVLAPGDRVRIETPGGGGWG